MASALSQPGPISPKAAKSTTREMSDSSEKPFARPDFDRDSSLLAIRRHATATALFLYDQPASALAPSWDMKHKVEGEQLRYQQQG